MQKESTLKIEKEIDDFFDYYDTNHKRIVQPIHLWTFGGDFLSRLNKDFFDHSVRVGHIMLRYCQKLKLSNNRTRKLVFSAFFHDIGAYRSDEFPNLSSLEPKNTFEHCYKGYLFLKYFSPHKESAKILLYHHATYRRKRFSQNYKDGLLVHLIDRVDIYHEHFKDLAKIEEFLNKSRKVIFNPKDVDDMKKLLKETELLKEIEDNRSYEILYSYTQHLRYSNKLLSSTLNMFSHFFEMYNVTTLDHSLETAIAGVCLAKCLHYDDDRTNLVYIAGLLHDIGKVEIPLSIIEKKGKLTDEEYSTMKKHAQYSYDILKPIFNEKIVDICYHHQERLDGSGYPNHLKEENLTEEDKLIEIADVISALFSSRSYKRDFTSEKISSLLNSEKDKHKLDSKIIDLYIENQEMIHKMMKKRELSSKLKYHHLLIEQDAYGLIKKLHEN